MRSVRLDEQLEKQLEEASRVSGASASEFVREAVRERCRKVLSTRLDRVLADVIGSISVGGPGSRKTGREFTRLLVEREKARRAKRRRSRRS